MRSIIRTAALAILGAVSFTSGAGAQVSEHDIPKLYEAKIQEILDRDERAKKFYNRSEVVKHVTRIRAEQELSKELGFAIGSAKPVSKGEGNEPLASMSGKNVSKTTSNFETETSVAMSRTNSSIIVAGANDDEMLVRGMKVYRTSNGGATWATRHLPVPEHDQMVSGGDPVVVPDEAGGFYYSFLSYDFTFSWSDIQFAHSTDGVNWELRSPVVQREDPTSILEDKQWVAVDRDPQSPYFGRIYVVWNRYELDLGSSRPLISWSDDRALTWTEPRDLGMEFSYFAFIRVGKGGVVFLSGSSQGSSTGQHAMLVSQDGGASFTLNIVDNYRNYPQSGGRPKIKGTSGFRAFPYTSFDVNMETNELFMIGGTYDAQRRLADLRYYYSSNLGETWREFGMVAAAAETRGDRWLPAVSFDQKTKTAWATYYSSEHDADNQMTKIYRARLTSSGIGELDTLQNDEFDPLMSQQQVGSEYIGDYVGSDASGGVHVAIWSQQPAGKRDAEVYAAVSTIEAGPSGSVAPVTIVPFELSEALEQPAKNTLSFSIAKASGAALVMIYDGRMSEVMKSEVSISGDHLNVDIAKLASGFYTAIIEIDGASVMRKFVKQ
jgi:hypothetical protein